jgi:hypothetical protein
VAGVAMMLSKEVLNKLIPLMVRQAHHERNQYVTVHPEFVEGFNQRFPKSLQRWCSMFNSMEKKS